MMGMPVTYSTIEQRLKGGVLIITLNRPAKLNAFSVQMSYELEDAFDRASADDDVRAIIVTGEGRAFCAGMDLSVPGNVFGLNESLRPTLRDLEERLEDPAIAGGVRDTGGRVTLAIFRCLKPVIGAIHGAAVGIGATMTLPMDYRIAASNARIGFVFSKIGIVPEACSTWFLPRLVGLPKALEWTYTGDIFDAQEAHATGLVQKVVEPPDLIPEALRVADRYTQNRSGVSIALTRQMMYRNSALTHPLGAHLTDSLAVFYLGQMDGREGVQAFLEKRNANFGAKVSTDIPEPLRDWLSMHPK